MLRAIDADHQVSSPRADIRKATVRIVIDGDTFETRSGERIRLLGIDAPEVSHHGQPGEFWGKQATDWLSEQVVGQQVSLVIPPGREDAYGRTLAWAFLSDGTLINRELLRTGNARLLERFGLPLELQDELRSATAEAQVRRLGLWQ